MKMSDRDLARIHRPKETSPEKINRAFELVEEELPYSELEGGLNICQIEDGTFSFRLIDNDVNDTHVCAEVADSLVEEWDTMHELLDPRHWKRMAEITFENGEEVLDVSSELPEAYRVYNYYFDGYDRFHGRVSFDDKAIFLIGQPRSLRSVMTLLHEIGHAKDEGYDLESYQSNNLEVLITEKLRSERQATAYEYSKLRKFIKDPETRRLIQLVTYENDLGSYNESFKT